MNAMNLAAFEEQRALQADARTICRILNDYTFEQALRLVEQFRYLESPQRLQRVLQNHFNSGSDAQISSDTLRREAELLRRAFPVIEIKKIEDLLKLVHESNRVRVVAGMLAVRDASTLKRPTQICPDVPIKKPRKVKTKTLQPCTSSTPNWKLPTSNSKDQPWYNIIDNGSTGIDTDTSRNFKLVLRNMRSLTNALASATREKGLNFTNSGPNNEETLTNDVSCATVKTEPNFANSLPNHEEPLPNIDSTTPCSENESQEMDSQATITVTPIYSPNASFEGYDPNSAIVLNVDNEEVVVSNDEDLNPTMIKTEDVVVNLNVIGERNLQHDPQIKTESAEENSVMPSSNQVQLVNKASCVPPPKISSVIAERLLSRSRKSPILENVHTITSTKCCNAKIGVIDLNSSLQNHEKFDIYKRLQDMFSNATRYEITSLCEKYSIDPYIEPDINVFNAIASDLYEMLNAESGDSDVDELLTHIESEVEKSHKPSKKCQFLIPSSTCVAPTAYIPPTQVNPTLNYTGQVAFKVGENCIETLKPEEMAEATISNNNDDDFEKMTLIHRLMEIFPEACPDYIRNMCRGQTNEPGVMDRLISEILDADYPRRQRSASPKNLGNVEDQLNLMKQIIPDADPNYLRINCEQLIDTPDELRKFISELVERRNYPTMKDYLRNQQLSAQQKQYTTEFKIQKYLELIPEPGKYFKDRRRKPATSPTVSADIHYTLCFLRNKYLKIQVSKIRELFKSKAFDFLATCRALNRLPQSSYMKSKRIACEMPEPTRNIPLLQEIAYIQHKNEIKAYLEERKVREKQERDNARDSGLFQTCNCCYDEEVMLKDIYICENGCQFCKECVQKSIEVAFGEGKLDYPCLSDCGSYFSLQTLQVVLDPKTFSIIALKKQVQEVKAAGIEDLEMCPFCDFATIPAQNDKLFCCLNPECMKESCRLCKEPSHVPLRCDEVEKEDEVKNRTYIENKMTEALIRKCYKCGLKFIKSDGCNKMTCSCGAMMCYVCKQPVQDYKHFNGQGGDQTHLCPLYSNTIQLHEEGVLQGAKKAKMEIGIDNDPSKLKHDPSSTITKHYKEEKTNQAIPQDFAYDLNIQHVMHQAHQFDADNYIRIPVPEAAYRVQYVAQINRNQLNRRNRHLNNR